MKSYKIFILDCFVALAIFLSSCTKEVDFTGTQSDPLLVVNGLEQVGQRAWLSVEKSVFFLDDRPDCRVKDVHVDLYVNGVFKESLQVRDSLQMEEYIIWTEEGEILKERLVYAFNYCEGEYILCEGDELRFEISAEEFETATAEVTMPEAPHVISFDTVRIESQNEYEINVSFALKLDDPAGTDYYNLYPKDGLSGFTSSDPVFTDISSIDDIEDVFGENEYYGWGKYNAFTDKFFDGSEYTLSMEKQYYFGEYDDPVFYEPFTLEVTRMDANLYQYLKSYWAYSNSDPESLVGMFTEPVQVYSNVKKAAGVVGAQSRPVVMTIDLCENYLPTPRK